MKKRKYATPFVDVRSFPKESIVTTSQPNTDFDPLEEDQKWD